MPTPPAWLKPATRWLVALSFTWIGVMHFVDPAPFLKIMPAYLPWHLELVYLSGAFEVAGGLGLLAPVTRPLAAWGLLALLLAVYPANVNMLVNDIYLDGMPRERWLLWARMPMQLLFAAGVAWTGGLWPRR